MSKWHLLRKQILRRLKRHLQKAPPSQVGEYQSFTASICDIPLVDFVCNFKDNILCYFKNKEGTEEYLGVEILTLFQNDNDLDLIRDLLSENKTLTFLGGQSFSQEEKYSKEWEGFGHRFIFIPKILFKKKDGAYTLTFYYTCDAYNAPEALEYYLCQMDYLLSFRPFLLGTKREKYQKHVYVPSFEKWNQAVVKCTDAFSNHQKFLKVVLAKKETFTYAQTLHPLNIFKQTYQNAHESYCFYLQIAPNKSFLSLSPERLFKISGQTIYMDCIAGSRPRGKKTSEKALYSNQLLTSPKELNEHQIVVNEVFKRLKKICFHVSRPKHVELLKLRYIQHLFTELEGTLRYFHSLEKTMKLLHPTPAVGGSPWKWAQGFINDSEKFQRGLYAGPVGVITYKKTEFAVAIRSCLIDHKSLHLYAGAGIVPGSIGAKEWDETQNKMRNFLQIL